MMKKVFVLTFVFLIVLSCPISATEYKNPAISNILRDSLNLSNFLINDACGVPVFYTYDDKGHIIAGYGLADPLHSDYENLVDDSLKLMTQEFVDALFSRHYRVIDGVVYVESLMFDVPDEKLQFAVISADDSYIKLQKYCSFERDNEIRYGAEEYIVLKNTPSGWKLAYRSSRESSLINHNSSDEMLMFQSESRKYQGYLPMNDGEILTLDDYLYSHQIPPNTCDVSILYYVFGTIAFIGICYLYVKLKEEKNV